MRFSDLELIGVGLGTFTIWYLCDDWMAPAAVLVLWLCIKLVSTGDRLYVLPLALSFQWTQCTLGIFYKPLTGHEVQAHDASDYRPMVLIGTGSEDCRWNASVWWTMRVIRDNSSCATRTRARLSS